MSTLIIGGGLAGLATAVKLKLANPNVPILLVDYPNANTQIAGQRYTRRIGDISSLKEHLLGGGSNPNAIEGIEKIVDEGNNQIDFWQGLDVRRLTNNKLNNLPYAENKSWFGPK